MVQSLPVASRRTQRIIKRCFDLAVAVPATLGSLLILALAALAIKLENPRLPIFFNETRSGQWGRPFPMLKFRTMHPQTIDYDNHPEVRPGDPRVTAVGRLLRRFRLDELPQLGNVLRGEMSIVGPRPMDLHKTAKLDAFQRQRLLVKPGLTGWAQVNGNTLLSWDERITLDLWYIASWSLWLDIAIVLRTVALLFLGEKIRHVGHKRISDRSVRLVPEQGAHGDRRS